MDIKTRRKMMAILRVLHEAPKPQGSQRIAETLMLSGIDLGERTVRNYLAQADKLGWTENLGRRGRRLTILGRNELENALVLDKVGFVSAHVDSLSFQMDFDPVARRGRVILNVSTLAPRDFRPALERLTAAYNAGLGMGRRVAFGVAGETIGSFEVPQGCIAIGTVCSVSINGLLLKAGVPTVSRFGGLLELEERRPFRFIHIIRYDGTSIDPLEIFIRGQMTSVAKAAATGSGLIGASFREVPMDAIAEVDRISKLSEKCGLGGTFAMGSPNQPLLDIPVSQGRVGMIVCGGLNPVAAIVEDSISVTSAAMCTLAPYESLIDYRELFQKASQSGV